MNDNNSAAGLALQTDGKILIAGTVFNEGSNVNDVLLAKFDTSGTPDKTFDEDGIFTTHLDGFNNYTTCFLIKGNKAYLNGYTFTPAQTGFVTVYLLGACIPATILSKAQPVTQDMDILVAKAYPNPSIQSFTISLSNKKNKNTFVRVSDGAGRLMETKANILQGTTFN